MAKQDLISAFRIAAIGLAGVTMVMVGGPAQAAPAYDTQSAASGNPVDFIAKGVGSVVNGLSGVYRDIVGPEQTLDPDKPLDMTFINKSGAVTASLAPTRLPPPPQAKPARKIARSSFPLPNLPDMTRTEAHEANAIDAQKAVDEAQKTTELESAYDVYKAFMNSLKSSFNYLGQAYDDVIGQLQEAQKKNQEQKITIDKLNEKLAYGNFLLPLVGVVSALGGAGIGAGTAFGVNYSRRKKETGVAKEEKTAGIENNPMPQQRIAARSMSAIAPALAAPTVEASQIARKEVSAFVSAINGPAKTGDSSVSSRLAARERLRDAPPASISLIPPSDQPRGVEQKGWIDSPPGFVRQRGEEVEDAVIVAEEEARAPDYKMETSAMVEDVTLAAGEIVDAHQMQPRTTTLSDGQSAVAANGTSSKNEIASANCLLPEERKVLDRMRYLSKAPILESDSEQDRFIKRQMATITISNPFMRPSASMTGQMEEVVMVFRRPTTAFYDQLKIDGRITFDKNNAMSMIGSGSLHLDGFIITAGEIEMLPRRSLAGEPVAAPTLAAWFKRTVETQKALKAKNNIRLQPFGYEHASAAVADVLANSITSQLPYGPPKGWSASATGQFVYQEGASAAFTLEGDSLPEKSEQPTSTNAAVAPQINVHELSVAHPEADGMISVTSGDAKDQARTVDAAHPLRIFIENKDNIFNLGRPYKVVEVQDNMSGTAVGHHFVDVSTGHVGFTSTPNLVQVHDIDHTDAAMAAAFLQWDGKMFASNEDGSPMTKEYLDVYTRQAKILLEQGKLLNAEGKPYDSISLNGREIKSEAALQAERIVEATWAAPIRRVGESALRLLTGQRAAALQPN